MEPSNSLTTRQQEVFDFISDYIHGQSKPPTFREIGEQFSIKSTNGVRSLLTALEKKGCLKVFPRISRGIQLTVDSSEQRNDGISKIPILGSVAAGRPVLAVEDNEGTLLVDTTLVGRNRKTFALKVRGDSMIGAGILQGDMVIVHQTTDVRNGDIVVAVIDSDATVKRFYKENNRVVLEAENEKYSPIIIEPDSVDLRIAGKVIGVLRKY